MPTLTFKNLSLEKKNRIMEACFDEFSHYSFSEASINRIIKQARISRGSFYQYFKDKEDCYIEVLSQIAQRKMEIFKDIHQVKGHLSVFDQLIQMMKNIAIWMEKEPRLYRIGVLMDTDNSAFVDKLRRQNPSIVDYYRNLIEEEQNKGKIRSDIDADTLSDLMVVTSQHILHKYFKEHNFEGMIEKADLIFSILKRGTQGDEYV